ncbi:hypothetical protein LOTGIDRAFT_222587 [Lottia gigantea]|uniref:Protein farnesyltransferase subunit beta n=1 Tax=Lottia gigantea TaxID=225164 RepID=V3YZC1_LOTGI|nr:hypothetical protein LOTGIDRAFT_222587 [Lottia gigantea]ESO83518.1 hypothetical protein LOTGIDRAFT_222587 [Lottia gigantea]
MEEAQTKLRFSSPKHSRNKFDDENISTESSVEQIRVEDAISVIIDEFNKEIESDPDIPVLKRDEHTMFLWKGLRHLGISYECLDASRPWLCYWILHSMEILEETIPIMTAKEIAKFLGKCQCSTGGFAGGPGQVAHLAPTYAAVNALCILSQVTDEALNVINRETLYEYLLRMRTDDGAFLMHEGGEVDIRGTYCAASVAKLTNLCTKELFKDTPQWLARCQTYEGGFSGAPGLEAHGGYSFCGIAALLILNATKHFDIKALLRWTVNRQMKYEGGFQGRTNKLVDGCYSFWQGGALPLIHMVLCAEEDPAVSANSWLFDTSALQEYLLICCQHPNGGLIDKPGKTRDYYHTCYCLSGLSVAQHFTSGHLYHTKVVGSPKNAVRSIHPVFNIGVEAVVKAKSYFSHQVPVHKDNGKTS